MQILSVVSLKTLERYGYTYLKEIVLRKADYKEYKISEADFKILHPNDFEDLYLLHLQGYINHLSGADKVHLFNAVNPWIRNIVIKKRVEDLQLRIESSYKDGDGVILFRQRQVHYRMLILDQHIQRNHESSSIYQERYEHVGPQDTRSQDGKRPQVDDQRLDLADDLKEERNMEMEPDIENMMMSEYLEYEAAKERRLWDDVRSRRSPTNYNGADVDSFHRNKSKTFSYPYTHNLTPPRTCFLPVQPYPKNYLVSTNESNDVDIENMTIAEYNLYIAKQGLGMNQLIQDSIWEHDDDLEEDQEEDGSHIEGNDAKQAARKHPKPVQLDALLDGGCCSKRQTWSMA
ncbi:hypothetical protein Tco_0088530 [Tanacetum coccineum]